MTLAEGSELRGHVVMIATGAKVTALDLPGLEPLVGRSVYYGAATSEAANYRGRRVFVLGGADHGGVSVVVHFWATTLAEHDCSYRGR